MKKFQSPSVLPEERLWPPPGDLLLALTLVFSDSRVRLLDYSPRLSSPHQLSLYRDYGQHLAPVQLRSDVATRMLGQLRSYTLQCQREITKEVEFVYTQVFQANGLRVYADGRVHLIESMWGTGSTERYRTHYFHWKAPRPE